MVPEQSVARNERKTRFLYTMDGQLGPVRTRGPASLPPLDQRCIADGES